MVAVRHILHLPVIVAFVLFSVAARANTPVVTENNINDLNADRDRFSVVEGALYITHTASDGVAPINFSSATSSFLAVSFVEGSYTARVDAATSLGNDGVVRWNVPFIFAGDYRLTGYAFFPDAERVVFDRFVTVTGVPVAAANISATFTNETTINLTQPSNTVSLSLVPLIASNGFIGTPDVPWGEVNAVTGRFSGSLIVEGTLDVGGSIEALDSTKVLKIGETNLVDLTNTTLRVADPVADVDAASKGYVDSVAGPVAFLDDVGDVDVTGVPDGQILQRLGGRWTNAPLTAGAGAFFIASGENIAPTSSVGNVIGAGTVLSTISGGGTNEIAPSALYATIGGGVENYATTEGTVSGGKDNRAIALGATIGGGGGNDVASGSGYYDTIAGGDANYIFSGPGSSQGRSTIGGGRQNRIWNTRYATIGGGWANAITGEWSTVSGGYFNSIQSNAFYSSISGGHTVRLRATDTHALGGRLSGVDATNSVLVGGLRQTNRVPNSVLLGHQVTAFVFAPDIPNNPPGDQVLTAWVNYGSSQTWYAVSQTATSIIGSIPP